ncbi:AsnC family transcriptional regulator [Shinella sp. AETb1-6]|nr:AsnC family transcriptional regulator [Shinella sp. AETb1-6]
MVERLRRRGKRKRLESSAWKDLSEAVRCLHGKTSQQYHCARKRIDLILLKIRPYGSIFPILEVSLPEIVNVDSPLDSFDRKILEELAQNGRIPVAELAEKVGLSKTPCQNRFKRLIADGFIQGFKAILNPAKMNLDHIAFAEVKLTNTQEEALMSFNAAVKKIREVEECHMIAGRFDYLLKIRTRDIKKYRLVLGERISNLPYVASTSTNVAMETVKERG